ncbi:MAG TPA: peptidylprolyl isomerase [Bacteroidota bacterium]
MSQQPKTRNRGFLAAAIFGTIICCAGCSPGEQDAIVAKVGTQPVRLSEYEQQYIKSLGNREAGAATSQDDREKFLDLVVKYRLKLAGAHDEGLDKHPEVLNEIAAYKGSLAASYLTEREVITPGVRQLYARQNEEIRASHILLSLTPSASASDSAAAYKKAYEIISAARSGVDFGMLALEHSQDPSAKLNKGDLYYFTAGQLVSPFEDAAFAMKIGEISSAPVRTQYGLHIIKLVDRKPAPGEVHASHIMIRFQNPNPPPQDTAQAYGKIKALKDSLGAGANFASLATGHSEDPGSAGKGGDLGYFSRRRWVQPFDEVAMNLKPGQVSDIVRTPYGYHLIKCYDVRARKSFDAAKQELQPIYQQLRYQDDYAKFLDRLKKEVHFKLYDSTLTRFLASVDTNGTTHDSAWWSGIKPGVGTLPLFSVQDQRIAVDSVVRLIEARPELAGTSLRAQPLAAAVDKIGEQLVFSAKADLLAKNVPEFAALLAEYREGILLYQVEQEHVWNRIVMGDSVLKPYFAANRDKFTWPDRISITEMRGASDSLAGVISRRLLAGQTIETVAAADSIRLASPTVFRTSFARGSAKPDANSLASLSAMVDELRHDSGIRVTITARPDTSKGKSRSQKLAVARLEAIRSHLINKLKINPVRVTIISSPLPAEVPAGAENPVEADIIRTDLSGRTPLVFGKPETVLLPPPTDERTQRADTLAVGNATPPFLYKGYYTIVRLNAREKARRKTYEEAGPELSSAYQDYESKRLESDWLAQLGQKYPIVEYKPILKNAFVPAH